MVSDLTGVSEHGMNRGIHAGTKLSFKMKQQQWTKHVIVVPLWNTVDRFWKRRYEVLHVYDQLAKQIRESPLDSRIKDINNSKDKFATTTRALFSHHPGVIYQFG
jgi:hypothetical protein